MNRSLAVALLLAATTLSPAGAAPKQTRFWNLTGNTINTMELSKAGENKFGPNQCANDKDGTVDPDERLRITGITTGEYDVKFTDVRHRTCEAKKVTITEGAVFSLNEKEITCQK